MLRQAYPRLGMGRGVGVQHLAVSSTSLPGISAALTSALLAWDTNPKSLQQKIAFLHQDVLHIVVHNGYMKQVAYSADLMSCNWNRINEELT